MTLSMRRTSCAVLLQRSGRSPYAYGSNVAIFVPLDRTAMVRRITFPIASTRSSLTQVNRPFFYLPAVTRAHPLKTAIFNPRCAAAWRAA